MKSSAQEWIEDLHNRNPELPTRLEADFERKRLDVLESWFERLEENREIYEENSGQIDVPDSFEGIRGGRQIIPALATPMTPEEQKARHELFVAISTMLANITHTHWQRHAGEYSAITFEDALNYLPVAFLFALAGYDADRQANNHEVDFSDKNADWVRLPTWIYQDLGRHIQTYLRERAHTIDKGSGYVQDIKRKIRQIRNEKYAKKGRNPTDEEVADELEDRLEDDTSEETVLEHVRTLSSEEEAVSMQDTVSQRSGDDLKFGDVVSGDAGVSVKEVYRPREYFKERIKRSPLLDACLKVAFGNDALTFRERHHFCL